MILKNKINLIWYGRGNLTEAGDCDSFDLQSTEEPTGSRPSNLIEMVYRVASDAQGNSGWQQWTSLDFLAGNYVDAEFTSLECGHLYLVIMQDGEGSPKSINIPEAIVADHDTATTTIDDAPLVVSPDNVVEDENEGEDGDGVVAFECLPDAEWEIYAQDGNYELSNGSVTLGYDGFLGAGPQFKLGVPKGTTFGVGEASDEIAITDTSTAVSMKITAKNLPESTKVRIEVLAYEISNANQGEVEGGDASSPIGCWEGTVDSEQKVALEKIGESTSSEDTADPAPENPVVPVVPVVPDDDDAEETYASCLGFADGDAVNSYRLRFNYNAESVENTSADFKLYQKTDTGQIEITEETDTTHAFIFSMVPDMIEQTIQKDFSIFFSAPAESIANANIVIMYPQENSTVAFSADSTDTGELTVSRIAIYDASRVADGDDTPYCADFVPSAGTNQFTGSSMV